MSDFVLSAIDGSNPLGFLAAVGTLRLSTLNWPGGAITLRWTRSGRWSPVIGGIPLEDESELCEALLHAPGAPVEEFEMLGKNLTVSPSRMEGFLLRAEEQSSFEDRRSADFAAAFASEAFQDRNGRAEYTDLCFITGSGHQDFLGTISDLTGNVTAAHIREALFGEWLDRQKGSSFRWNPSDARSYALRWDDPGPEGSWTTWGANRLAFEALPLFPTVPQRELFTIGFQDSNFTWPIWLEPLTVDELASLVASAFLAGSSRAEQRRRGIVTAFRSARIRIGQGANFKVSFRAPRAI